MFPLDTFSAFTPMHGLSLLGSGLAIAGVVIIGLAARRRGHEATVGRWVGILGLVNWVVQTGYYAVIDWDPYVSLPLHVCDLAALIGPLALLTGYRPLRGLLYFWAIAFTTQGLITPTLEEGPAWFTFWLFWFNHAGVIGLAVYDVIVRRYRPTWPDLVQVFTISLAYIAIIFPVNVVMGWNYAFVGPSRPNTPTIIDALGPWPQRVVLEIFMGFMMMVHVWLPWPIATWLVRRRARAASPPSPLA